MTRYIDAHTLLSALLVFALVVLAALGKIDGATALAAILAAVSPGLVLKGKAQRDEEQAESLRVPPPDDPPAPPTTKEAA
jgi:hypothetical protein